MTQFQELPILPGARPCVQVNPADVDLADMEYTPITDSALPKAAAETEIAFRQALTPFGIVGEMYRQANAKADCVVLSAEGDGAETILAVRDFTRATDILAK